MATKTAAPLSTFAGHIPLPRECGTGSIGPLFSTYLDRGKAITVNFAAVTTPVLAIRAECDRCITPQVALWIAARYQRGTYVEIPRSDHLVFNGATLPSTMAHIDDWIARNHVLAIA